MDSIHRHADFQSPAETAKCPVLADTAMSSRSESHLVNRRLPEETGPSTLVVTYSSNRPITDINTPNNWRSDSLWHFTLTPVMHETPAPADFLAQLR